MSSDVYSTERKRGFTLTELAIVLGIIGLILGAIWTAASKVYANNRVAKAVTQVLSIASSVRGTYASRGVISTTGVDLTAAGVSFGWYPTDMIQNNACSNGVNPCAFSPWNTSVEVQAATALGGAPAAANQFIIYYTGGPNGGVPRDCPAFMAAVIQQAVTAGLTWTYSNSGGGGLTVNTSTPLTESHIVNCGSDVIFSFTL